MNGEVKFFVKFQKNKYLFSSFFLFFFFFWWGGGGGRVWGVRVDVNGEVKFFFL